MGIYRAHRHCVTLEAAVRGHAIPGQRLVRIQEGAALVCVYLREQPLHRHLEEVWIGDVLVAVVEGDLLRLDEEVHGVRAQPVEPRKVHGLDEV